MACDLGGSAGLGEGGGGSELGVCRANAGPGGGLALNPSCLAQLVTQGLHSVGLGRSGDVGQLRCVKPER